MASRLRPGAGRSALVRAVRGLAGGSAGMCTLAIAGALALAERDSSLQTAARPSNDYLETFLPAGWPGSDGARPPAPATEFMARFTAHAKRLGVGTACHEVSGVDWQGGNGAARDAAFRRDRCVAIADAAVTDLNELLPEEKRPTATNIRARPRRSLARRAAADPEAAL